MTTDEEPEELELNKLIKQSEVPLTLNDTSLNQDTADHHLSLNAYHGSKRLATISFSGSINGKRVQVLLDGGSSDNFIQPRVAKHVRLPIEPADNLKVMVGNDSYIEA